MIQGLNRFVLVFLLLAIPGLSFAAYAVRAAPLIEPAPRYDLPRFAVYTATITPTPRPSITTRAAPVPTCLPDTPLSLVYLPNSSIVSDILPLPDGSFLLHGRIDKSEATWLAKMDASGKLLWQNLYGSRMGAVHLGVNGNIVLEFDRSNLEIDLNGKVVRALGFYWYHPNADNSFTIIDGGKVARYKDQQTVLWQTEIKGFGGLSTTTSDGGALFAYAGSYVDKSVYYAPIYTDVKVIKIRPDGQAIQRVYGRLVGDETLDYLQSTSDGGALLAGTHYYEQLGSDYDIWLMKINAGGGLSWQKTLKRAPYGETLQNIYSLDKGYLVVLGAADNNDPTLVRLNANGSLGWQEVITSSRGPVEIHAAADTVDGGVLLAGMTWEKTSVYWLAKVDSKGRLVWEKTLGYQLPGAPDSEVLTMLPLANKQILLGGLTNQLGGSLAREYSAWIAQIPDSGKPLGLLKLLPGKVSVISALGSRPNTLMDEIVLGNGIPLKEVAFSVVETNLLPSPACLPAGAVFPSPAALPSLTPSITPTLALTRNLFLTDPQMRGDDVLKLQQRLYELGYTEVGARDGIFGPMTESAVRNFQIRNHLEVDGYVGPKTWIQLFSPSAIKAGR